MFQFGYWPCGANGVKPRAAVKVAERLRSTLAKLTRVLGPEHPDALVCQADLAVTLRGQGRFEESEELATAILAGLERVLGRNHPDIVQLRAGQRINRDLEPQLY